jgi:hypothetical protein
VPPRHARGRNLRLPLRAERGAGKVTAKLPKSPGGRPRKNSSHDITGFKAEALERAGINKMECSRWEQVASLDDERFEAYIVETQAAGMVTREIPKAPGTRTDITSNHDATRSKSKVLEDAGINRMEWSRCSVCYRR